MKRLCGLGLVIVVLFCIMPIVCAERILIYKGEIENGATKQTTNAIDFSAQLNTDETLALVLIEDQHFILRNNTCKHQNNLTVCIENMRDLRAGALIWTLTPKISLNISKDLAGVSIDKTSSRIKNNATELNVNDIIDISVKLQGIDKDIENATFSETYPSSMTILSVEGCEKDGNALSWSGLVERTSPHYCKYRLQALVPGTFVVKTSVSYNDGINVANPTASTSFTILEPPIDLAYILIVKKNDKNYTDDSPANLSLNLGESIDLTSSLIGVRSAYINNYNITYLPGFKRIENNQEPLFFNSFLPANTTKNFSTELLATHTGSDEISIYGAYVYGSRQSFMKLTIPYAIQVDFPVTAFSFEEERKTILAAVDNPTTYTFNNITITGYTKKREFDVERSSLLAPKHLFEARFGLTEDEIAESGVFINISFFTEYGEELSIIKEVPLRKDTDGGIVVGQSNNTPSVGETNLSSSSIDTGDGTTISVTTTPASSAQEREPLNQTSEWFMQPKYILIGCLFGLMFILISFFLLKKKRDAKKKMAAITQSQEHGLQTQPVADTKPLYTQFVDKKESLADIEKRLNAITLNNKEKEQYTKDASMGITTQPVEEKDLKRDVAHMEDKKETIKTGKKIKARNKVSKKAKA